MAQMAAWHRWLCWSKELVAASPRSPSCASSSSDESVPPQRVWADVRRRALGNLETCGTFHVALRCWNKFEHVWFWSVELCPAWTVFLDVCGLAGVLRVISWQAGTSLKDHAAGALIRSVAATILAIVAGRELGVSLCCVDAGWDRIDLECTISSAEAQGGGQTLSGHIICKEEELPAEDAILASWMSILTSIISFACLGLVLSSQMKWWLSSPFLNRVRWHVLLDSVNVWLFHFLATHPACGLRYNPASGLTTLSLLALHW